MGLVGSQHPLALPCKSCVLNDNDNLISSVRWLILCLLACRIVLKTRTHLPFSRCFVLWRAPPMPRLNQCRTRRMLRHSSPHFDYAREVVSQLPSSLSAVYPWLTPENTLLLPHSAFLQLHQYDTLADTFRLRYAPNYFEFQRGHYPLRRE